MSDTTEGTTPITETEGQKPAIAEEATARSEAPTETAEAGAATEGAAPEQAAQAATDPPAEPAEEPTKEAEAAEAPEPAEAAASAPEAEEAAPSPEPPAVEPPAEPAQEAEPVEAPEPVEAAASAPEAEEAAPSPEPPAPVEAPAATDTATDVAVDTPAETAETATGDEAVAAEAAPAEGSDAAAEPSAEASAEGEDAGEATAEGAAVEGGLPTDAVSLKLLEHLESGKPIQGKVFGWNQGGYHVLIDGLLAFCPRSEIDLGNPKAPKRYIEKKYPFKVIEHRAEGNRFIVSRAKILEVEREKRRAVTRERLSEGAVLEGNITSLTGFGAFVDLGGGIEGMVHISELSHKSVDHPKDLVKKGQKVQVKVLKIEQDGDRISLSMKTLEANPWKDFAEKYPRGAEFTGKVTGKTEFGVFVEVEPGMEGLIHVSALPPGTKLEDESLQQGQEVSGWVKDTEIKRKRISLSLRPVPTSDPWKDATSNYPEGDVFTGTVEEIAPFGVFINLEPGLTGLLPNSEMHLPRGTHPGRVYPPGSEVKVQVGRIEPKRKRITLLPEGSKVEGSQTDFREYKKKAKESLSGGMTTLAAAFEKLKQDQK